MRLSCRQRGAESSSIALGFAEEILRYRRDLRCYPGYGRSFAPKIGLGRTKVTYCSEYCLDMPSDFPAEDLARFMAAANQVLLANGTSSQWAEFGGASNLIGWRYRAASECWEAYRYSWTSQGVKVDHEGIYSRDLNLFGMFSSGVSCIESTAYALAALASHPAVVALSFGLAEQRACSPRQLALWLAAYPKAQSLATCLTTMCASAEWKQWIDLRNRMTHRSNLPRMLFASVGSPTPPAKALHFAATSSTPEIVAELSDFDVLNNWLTSSLSKLLIEGQRLASAP